MSVAQAAPSRRAPGGIRAAVGRFNSPRVNRDLRIGLLALVLVYAAVLRFDAILQMYGPADRPAWLHSLQVNAATPLRWLRPPGLTFKVEPTYLHKDTPPSRYVSDPYTYLVFARQMSSFYAAHRREPGYPFVTKVFLGLFENQDVAVSFGSAFCSVLVVLATYLLGALAFSPWVGVAAAAGMAIESDVIYWSALGGRDDLFTFTVLMFTCALIKYLRAPSRGWAIAVGIAAGAACLVRITAPTFVVPALAFSLLVTKQSWRDGIKKIGVALLVMVILVAPYVFNCWRVYGRPLLAIDQPAGVYQVAEGQAASQTAAGYVGQKLVARPYETLDTVAEGMTSYPFNNKWHGFDPWLPYLGVALSWAALGGLILFAGSITGWTLLIVLAASLLPYSITWKLSSEWRLTEVAYPFFLIAAFSAIAWVVGLADAGRWRALRGRTAGQLVKGALLWAGVLAIVAAGYYAVTRTLPAATVRERLAAREDVTIAAGGRDAAFFGDGWSAPHGDFVLRDAQAPRAVVWLPIPEVADYGVTVRLNPLPPPTSASAPLPTVRVMLNGTVLAALTLGWNPERIGSYDLRVPRAAVRRGFNRMEIVAADGRPTFSIWYVRVRPGG